MKEFVKVNEENVMKYIIVCVKEVDGKTYCRGCGNVQPEQEN